MAYWRCKCGKYEWYGSDAPAPCHGCDECHTTLEQTPLYHKVPEPHTLVVRHDELTGKPYSYCTRCHNEFPLLATIIPKGSFTHYIIKAEDTKKYLSSEEIESLHKLLGKIHVGRIADKRKPINDYLVINVDEPYASDIVEILKRNGDWG